MFALYERRGSQKLKKKEVRIQMNINLLSKHLHDRSFILRKILMQKK